MDIISMAQQARPKPRGQMELLRAQFTALSSVVKMMPSSSSRLPKSSGLVSVTCLPRDVLMVPSSDTTSFAQASGGYKRRRLDSSPKLGQFVVGEGGGLGSPDIGDDGAGPERDIFAGALVLIPTVAAAGLPDGTGEAAVD